MSHNKHYYAKIDGFMPSEGGYQIEVSRSNDSTIRGTVTVLSERKVVADRSTGEYKVFKCEKVFSNQMALVDEAIKWACNAHTVYTAYSSGFGEQLMNIKVPVE